MPRSSVPANNGAGAVKVFISYSHKDQKAREKLDIHLAQLKREGVQFWFDGDIHPGAAIDANVRREMRAADIFVALASPDYLHSTYCFDKEYSPALRKAARGKIKVVVALLRECQWKHTRMAAYKMLPVDGKAVDRWPRRGEAFEDIVNGLRIVIQAVVSEKNYAPASSKPVAAPAPKKPAQRKARPPIAKKAGPSRKTKAKEAKAPKVGATNPKSRTSSSPRKAVKSRAKRTRAPIPRR